MVWYMLSFLILFANFYRQYYNDPKKDKIENGSKNIKPSCDIIYSLFLSDPLTLSELGFIFFDPFSLLSFFGSL